MRYNFNVVGIGLSAGGLEPLLEIMRNMAADANAAVIVLSHIPVNHHSNLDRIVAKASPLKVVPVSTIEYLEPGNCYVAVVGQGLVVSEGFVQVEDRAADAEANRTIDQFFESLAADAGDRAIGVILSGAGYDGLEGARQIEGNNGLVIVQDPETAQFPLMPANLVANDHPDYVLTPIEIAQKISAGIKSAA